MVKLRNRVVKKGIIVALLIVLVATLTGITIPASVSIGGDGQLNFGSNIALAVQQGTMGDSGPVPQQIIPPTFRRGGPPIKSISFENNDITVICSGGLSPWVFSGDVGATIENYLATHTLAEVEQAANQLLQRHFEVWILVKDFSPDSRVRDKPPTLLDNERIESVGNDDYLVTTICYSAVHFYSVDPLKYTTKFNGLNAGPVTGEWWVE